MNLKPAEFPAWAGFYGRNNVSLRTSNHTRFTLNKLVFGTYSRKITTEKRGCKVKNLQRPCCCALSQSEQILKVQLRDQGRQSFHGTFWVSTTNVTEVWTFKYKTDCSNYKKQEIHIYIFLPKMFSNIIL